MNENKKLTIRTHLGGRAMPTPSLSAAIPCAVPDTHDLQGEQIIQRPRPGHAGGSRPSGHGAADALSGGSRCSRRRMYSTVQRQARPLAQNR